MTVFVLVHGAWGGAHGFRKVRGPLRAAGSRSDASAAAENRSLGRGGAERALTAEPERNTAGQSPL